MSLMNLWTRRGVTAAVAIACTMALAGAASAQSTLAKIKAAGVLKIGIADNLPWSKLNPDGSLSGIAPQQVLAVAQKLGIPKVEAVVAGYGQLVPGLLAGRWDMIGASLTITPERCSQVIFTDPFYRALEPEYIVYLPGSLKDLPKSYLEVAKMFDKIGMPNGAQIPFMQKAIETTASKAELVQFPDNPTMIEGLLAKRIPVAVTDSQTARLLKQQRGAAIETAPVDNGQPNRGSGGAFRREDGEFRDAFVAEQRKLKQSGEVKKILAEFNYVYDEKFMAISGDEACKLQASQ